jgi:hypothetical protein
MSKARLILISVAERDLNVRETLGSNRGPGIEKFWTATNYAAGYKDRQPYCAAAVCYWVAEAARAGVKFLAPLPRDAAVRNFLSWAKARQRAGQILLTADPQPGDIVSFLPHFSHIGLVVKRDGATVETIEANTTAAQSSLANEREGGGVYRRVRKLSICGTFIRLLTTKEGAQ